MGGGQLPFFFSGPTAAMNGPERVHSRRSEKEKMESSFKGGLTEPERKREGLIVSVVEAIF